MTSPNVTSCPLCGTRAHKTSVSWWRRLLFAGKAHYFCQACKHRFRRF